MADHGGFDHNKQSLRVVELLENAYPDFPGLNLTFEVREGLRKHETSYQMPEPASQFGGEGESREESRVCKPDVVSRSLARGPDRRPGR